MDPLVDVNESGRFEDLELDTKILQNAESFPRSSYQIRPIRLHIQLCPLLSYLVSINIPEILVLSISQVFKSVQHPRIQSWKPSGGQYIILLLVLPSKMPAQEKDGDNEEDIAAHVGRKGDEVARSVIAEKYLGS
jgi:hypothetical protein